MKTLIHTLNSTDSSGNTYDDASGNTCNDASGSAPYDLDIAALQALLPEGLALLALPQGLTLTDGRLSYTGDLSHMAARIRAHRLGSEMLVKAARFKKQSQPIRNGSPASDTSASASDGIAAGTPANTTYGTSAGVPAGFAAGTPANTTPSTSTDIAAGAPSGIASDTSSGMTADMQRHPAAPLRAVDATAGMGEDALLLAAAGFEVTLFEYNPIIAALLQDTLRRAADLPELKEAVSRMTLICGDSTLAMPALDPAPDVILLDPMFPARSKSGLIKKKFQLLQQLERPCSDEDELLTAAMAVRPKKLVIKRPLKGPFLAGVKPGYSLSGKAIRYDCMTFAQA